MARKQHRISNRMLLVWFTLAGFIFLLAPGGFTSRFQGAFAQLFRLPLRMGRTMSLSAQIVDSPHHELNRTQAQYENHITNLNAQIEEKTKQLQIVSGLRQRKYGLEGAALLQSDVISVSIEGPRNELIINRGKNDGLQQGQFVLGDNSVIGVISDVWSRTAKVQLITDINTKLTVTIRGLDKSVWMFGSGDGQAKVLWAKQRIPAGTNVMAEKQPGRLDSSIVIGKVVGCERNNQNALLWDITIKPACDIVMLRSVTVIVMNPEQ
ncbi:MAG: rod shape-determining protein MreC [Phycisphaerae bacterium]